MYADARHPKSRLVAAAVSLRQECGGGCVLVADTYAGNIGDRNRKTAEKRNIFRCVTWKQAGKGGRGCRESIPAGSLSRARFPFQPPFPFPRHPLIAGFGCASQASVLFGFGGGASGACITHPSNAEPIRPTPMPDAGGGCTTRNPASKKRPSDGLKARMR